MSGGSYVGGKSSPSDMALGTLMPEKFMSLRGCGFFTPPSNKKFANINDSVDMTLHSSPGLPSQVYRFLRKDESLGKG